jgi:predicted HTH transcriptional regulator
MQTDEFETLLQGAEETANIEFKTAVDWSARLFVKDILAMSNTLDGGKIIVGIEDRTLNRVGLSREQIATFTSDIMKDQIKPFADPLVTIRCNVVTDNDGLDFVVIDVSSFEEIPVICAKDGHDVNAGDIYFRPRSGRPRSERVTASADMREIIEASVARRLHGLRKVGLVSPPESYDFESELGGL